jgi:hypothetical protein
MWSTDMGWKTSMFSQGVWLPPRVLQVLRHDSVNMSFRELMTKQHSLCAMIPWPCVDKASSGILSLRHVCSSWVHLQVSAT